MIYGSVCSGIEAASVAWSGLPWQAAWFAEIEPFPNAVLRHHYPTVPNLGDFTKIGVEHGPIDLLVGGTPCQDFSVAGLRAGLAGERGALTIEFVRLAERLRPRWILWENVPGVLSADQGGAFGIFLGALAECGYGFAYRVLDAQYFGVPQRRRRVFVVGYFGDWRPAAAVLFERHSLSWHPAPRREARSGVATGFEVGPGASGLSYVAPTMDARAKDGPIRNQLGLGVAGTLDSGIGRSRGAGQNPSALVGDPVGAQSAHGVGATGADDNQAQAGHIFAIQDAKMPRAKKQNGMGITPDGPMYTIDGHGAHGVAHTLRGEGFDASEDGCGRGTPLVARSLTSRNQRIDGDTETLIAFDLAQITSNVNRTRVGPELPASTLNQNGQMHVAGEVVAFTERGRANGLSLEAQEGVAYPLTNPGSGGRTNNRQIQSGMAVRRLTPRECERLQGFPDDYTLVPYRGKPAADGPRYRALGNSMAVPVVRWIGERIEAVEGILATREETQVG